jgi:hypothetical protein
MNSQDLYSVVGCLFIVIVLVAIGSNILKHQKRVVEGMATGTATTTDKDKISVAVKSSGDKIADSVLVSKYRRSYEDTIIELEHVTNLAMIKAVSDNAEAIANDPSSAAAQRAMESINTMDAFRKSLNTTMLALDKQKA